MSILPSPIARRICLFIAAAALFTGCGDGGGPVHVAPFRISRTAELYLDSALNIMEAKSVLRHQVDWPTLRRNAFALAGPAQYQEDTHEAIRYALKELGDGHSFLYVPNFGAVVPPVIERPSPRGAVLDGGRVGYVSVPFFVDTGAISHADEYHTLLRQLDSPAICGWVVDLRPARGGNMWPMLVGIGPILGDGAAGAFVDSDGERFQWGYARGSAHHAGTAYFPASNPYELRKPNPTVAVLTSNATVSAGEAIAVAFRGRPNTRIFGTPTRGLSTANAGFRLEDYWTVIYLTTAYFSDRNGVVYGGKLPPDVTVDAPEGPDPTSDPIAMAARAWLAEQPACKQ